MDIFTWLACCTWPSTCEGKQVSGQRAQHICLPDRPRLVPFGSPGGGFMIVNILYFFMINVVGITIACHFY